jgi:hypothetical protein
MSTLTSTNLNSTISVNATAAAGGKTAMFRSGNRVFDFETPGWYLPGDVIALVTGNGNNRVVSSLHYFSKVISADDIYNYYRCPAGDGNVPTEEAELCKLEIDVMAEILSDPILELHVVDEVRRVQRRQEPTTTYDGRKSYVLGAIQRFMVQQGYWRPARRTHNKAKDLLAVIEKECWLAYRRAESAYVRQVLVTFAEEGEVHRGYVTVELKNNTSNEFVSKFEITRYRPNLDPVSQADCRVKDVLKWIALNTDLQESVFTEREVKLMQYARETAKRGTV